MSLSYRLTKMGTRLQLSLLCFAIFLLWNAQESLSLFLFPIPSQGFNITTTAHPPLPHYPETHTLLAPILTNLGYTELAMAVPSLYDSYLSSWAGPATLFAINDQAIRSCSSCSRPQILKERIIPGLFTYHHLSKLAHGTKIQTMSSDRCITVTSMNSTENTTKILIDDVQITRPDLFNDGLLVIHGLDGFVFPPSPQSSFSPENYTSPLTYSPENHTSSDPYSTINYTSPLTYSPENYTSPNTNSTVNYTSPLTYSPENYTSPPTYSTVNYTTPLTNSPVNYTSPDTYSPANYTLPLTQPTENTTGAGKATPSHFPNTFPTMSMRSSLRDVKLRLRSSGFSIAALALKLKYRELVALRNMTIFALDDRSILHGGHAYVNNVRFHIVPDRYLKGSDLAQLQVGARLRTLVHGQNLVVTNPGSAVSSPRINFSPLKGLDVAYNSRIVVHSISVPFPRIGVADWIISKRLPHEMGSTAEIAPVGRVAALVAVDNAIGG
ncbi:hypothetical protein AMTRI_Chr04g244010 [Amborella trichopoda]